MLSGAGPITFTAEHRLQGEKMTAKLNPTSNDETNDRVPIVEQANEELLEPIPVMQKVLDNPFLLLFIGVTMPTVFYIIWGIMEIVTIPIAK